MEEEYKSSNVGQGLGIAGLVLGIIAFVIAFIPCLGMYAFVPGVIAVILSFIGYSLATKANAKRGILIAAMIISIVATVVAGWQYYIFKNAPAKIEQIGRQIQNAIEDDSNDDNKKTMEDLENAMEELEGEIEVVWNDTTTVKDSTEY